MEQPNKRQAFLFTSGSIDTKAKHQSQRPKYETAEAIRKGHRRALLHELPVLPL